jgi:hypothetical protein
MWISDKAYRVFGISKDMFNDLRVDYEGVRAERDALQRELTALRVTSDWMRLRFNELVTERNALLEKAYNVKLPSVQIEKAPILGNNVRMEDFTFDDIGEKLAKEYGFPTHTPPINS